MSRPSTEDRLAKIHAEALDEFNAIQAAMRDERLQCLQDRRFYSISGAQWEGDLGDQFENKPRFEFNKVHLAVIRIFNEYRNNRITVDFTPKDGAPNDKMADACDGLYRADEKASTADEAYDNAFEEAVGGGFGAWRLRTCYEDEEDDEDERQRVKIEPIFDADSCVFFTLDGKRYDKADASGCFVLTGMTPEAYKAEYDDDPKTWPKGVDQGDFDWAVPDLVYVAEYYKKVQVNETIHYFRSLIEGAEDMKVTDAELEADPGYLDELMARGFREVRQRTIKRQRVRKYLMSGGGILKDPQTKQVETMIAGRHIPIVPVYGKRWYIDGVERCMGHVRLAKDAQRLSNTLLSWLAEMAMRFDIEKPIVTPEQIKGHATMWAEDNISKFPYLLLNSMVDKDGNKMPAGPIGYTKAPMLPPAMAALAQIAEQALQDLLGNQQAGEQVQPNISGKAVELIQNRLDMQVYIYMSNLGKSMKLCGDIWLSMMKEIIVEEGRRMKTIAEDGAAGSVVLNQPSVDPETGEQMLENDLSKATFDVDVEVGPSSSSRRASAVRALTGLASITQDPEMQQALTLATIVNIEGEGLVDLRDWARQRGIRMGVIKPTEEEQKELAQEQANQKPDPQAEFLQAEAGKSEALAAKARAETVLTVAKTELTKADTVKTMAETDTEHMTRVVEGARAIREASTPPEQPTTSK